MTGGEGCSRSKNLKRKSELAKDATSGGKNPPSKTKDVQELADPSFDWPSSNLKENQIKILGADGFLESKEISHWRCAYQQEYPSEKTKEITVWKAFYEVGFGKPTCDFFRQILSFYGVELCHLTPNSILNISIFIHLCEAFLGIEPHYALFHHLFHMKVSTGPSQVVGKVVIQFRHGMKPLYLDYTTKESLKDWTKELFYASNHQPQLPARSGIPRVVKTHWCDPIGVNQAMQIPQLLNMIWDLKEQRLTGASVYMPFLMRKIQPCKQRCTPGYAYTGESDPSHNGPGL